MAFKTINLPLDLTAGPACIDGGTDGGDVLLQSKAERTTGGAYTGRLLINGEVYTPSEATKTFLRGQGMSGLTKARKTR